MSLVEVMITLGIASGLVLAVMQAVTMVAKQTKSVQVASDWTALIGNVRLAISNPGQCMCLMTANAVTVCPAGAACPAAATSQKVFTQIDAFNAACTAVGTPYLKVNAAYGNIMATTLDLYNSPNIATQTIPFASAVGPSWAYLDQVELDIRALKVMGGNFGSSGMPGGQNLLYATNRIAGRTQDAIVFQVIRDISTSTVKQCYGISDQAQLACLQMGGAYNTTNANLPKCQLESIQLARGNTTGGWWDPAGQKIQLWRQNLAWGVPAVGDTAIGVYSWTGDGQFMWFNAGKTGSTDGRYGWFTGGGNKEIMEVSESLFYHQKGDVYLDYEGAGNVYVGMSWAPATSFQTFATDTYFTSTNTENHTSVTENHTPSTFNLTADNYNITANGGGFGTYYGTETHTGYVALTNGAGNITSLYASDPNTWWEIRPHVLLEGSVFVGQSDATGTFTAYRASAFESTVDIRSATGQLYLSNSTNAWPLVANSGAARNWSVNNTVWFDGPMHIGFAAPGGGLTIHSAGGGGGNVPYGCYGTNTCIAIGAGGATVGTVCPAGTIMMNAGCTCGVAGCASYSGGFLIDSRPATWTGTGRDWICGCNVAGGAWMWATCCKY